jgi:hypothetical protein
MLEFKLGGHCSHVCGIINIPVSPFNLFCEIAAFNNRISDVYVTFTKFKITYEDDFQCSFLIVRYHELGIDLVR